ncbi:hypothetical protein EPO15_10665 [bacterium]|nr:MAG: hypothetical protein EPO15_10665 [bacterium]
MRRVLFLLHGVGEHGAGWARKPGGPAAVLVEASAAFAAFRASPLEERAALVPLAYDDLLDEAAARWRKSAADGARRAAGKAEELAKEAGGFLRRAPWLAQAADALEAGAARLRPLAEGIREAPSLAELAAALPAVEAAWPDHASDVAAWRADSLCRSEVRARIADEVRRALAPRAGEELSAVFAAHSLGTAVAHDALDDLGRRWLASDGPASPARWRWDAVFMLADVSRLLAVGGPESLVKAGPDADPGSWARRLFEVRHAWDPIDRVVPKADPAARPSTRIEVSHAWRANVHSFGHYLEHPAVHVPLLRALCGEETVTPAEEAAALALAANRVSVVSESKESLQSQLEAGVRRVKGLFVKD